MELELGSWKSEFGALTWIFILSTNSWKWNGKTLTSHPIDGYILSPDSLK